jgi:hypothetical protein
LTGLNCSTISTLPATSIANHFSVRAAPLPVRDNQLDACKPFAGHAFRFLPKKQVQNHSRTHEAYTTSTRKQFRSMGAIYCTPLSEGQKCCRSSVFPSHTYYQAEPPDARFSSKSTPGKSKGSTNSKWFHQHRPKLQARVRSRRFIQHQLILPCQQVLEALYHQRTNQRKPRLIQTKSPMTMPSQSSHPMMTHQSRRPSRSSTPRSGSRPQSSRNP